LPSKIEPLIFYERNGYFGIALIVCGLIIIGATSFRQPHEGKPNF
jgi:hypothetical protein